MKRRTLLLVGATVACTVLSGAGIWLRQAAARSSAATGLRPEALRELPALAAGDLLLRQGIGDESRLLQKIGGSVYSHIGMVVLETDGTPAVVHATTNDDPEHPDQVIRSSVSDFASHGLRLALLRAKLPEEKRAEAARLILSEIGKPFVLNPDAPRYCTTIIFDTYKSVDTGLRLHWQELDIPLMRGRYLFPKSFLESSRFDLLYESKPQFKQS